MYTNDPQKKKKVKRKSLLIIASKIHKIPRGKVDKRSVKCILKPLNNTNMKQQKSRKL